MIRKKNRTAKAFTIVELLIVIVVIGILAAITIVSFNGISGRASVAGTQADLNATAKVIENAKTTSSTVTYPADQTAAVAAGMNSSVTYTPAMGGYCATKTANNIVYMVTGSNNKAHTGPGCTLTNLISNPSIETVATGWTGAANVTISRSTTVSSNGTASLQVVRNTTAANGYVSIPITTTVGKKYSVSFDLRQLAGAPAVTATIKNASATGTTPADASTLSISPTASFTRYTVTWTAENAASYFVIDTPAAVAVTYALDSVLATEGDNSTNYTDPTLAGSTWTWTGALNASTSTGPAY